MSAVRDLQAYLEAEGLIDGSSGWPSSRSGVHDGSERLVVLAADGGGAPEIRAVVGIGDQAMQDPAVHVRVRGDLGEEDEAEDQIIAIYEAVHGRTAVVMGSTEYFRVAAQSGWTWIGKDEKGRPEYTISFRMKSLVPI